MMKRNNILVTCPPMLAMIEHFQPLFELYKFTVTTPNVIQFLTVDELINLVPMHDGWIIGDDPATGAVFEAGRSGRLRAAVKWGIGVDNIDCNACNALGISFTNTPNMFGAEVADLVMGYVIALARETFEIDRGVRAGLWPKLRGISLAGKSVALVGFGDIGKNTAKRMLAADMRVVVYDPFAEDLQLSSVEHAKWPNRLYEADYIVFTCALTSSSRHMFNAATLAQTKPGVRVVNVSRGPIIDERALEQALQSGLVYSAALDVFEEEPLPLASYFRDHPRCILGSHNASNTIDAVKKTSEIAIIWMAKQLGQL